jgi:hypothetical protein
MDTKSDAKQAPDPNIEATDTDADVAGHSLAAALFVNSRARTHTPDKTPAEESLPPLTKHFPRMRDAKSK